MDIRIERSTTPRTKVPVDQLGFGRVMSDHMFLMEAVDGVWQNPRILPYGPLAMDPAAKVLHYGQEIFEGMKAYRSNDGKVLLFRPEDNFRRLAEGAERLSMPQLPLETGMEALKTLLDLDRDWVPDAPATLYIRPFMFGDEAALGVSASRHITFCIITSPSGAYYASGLAPVRIYVEDKFVRAVRGGFGHTKTGGNYAVSIYPGEIAHTKGYDQVLWLDGVEQKYIEEVGAMNIFFLFDDVLVTPALQGSILSGITRKSVMQMAEDMGLRVEERRIAIDEVLSRGEAGELKEVFGSGTAAVISPVGELSYGERKLIVNGGEIGAVTQKLYDTLTGIQFGEIPDPYGWMKEV